MPNPMDFRIGAFNPQISRNTTITWRFTPSTPDALDDFTFAVVAPGLVASITVDGDDLLLTVTAGPVLNIRGYPLAVRANGQDFLTGAVYVSTTGTASPSPSTEIVARLPDVETPITLEVLVVGGLGQVVAIVDGDNIDVDDTDPANPIVSVTPGVFEGAGTAAGLVASEAGTRAAADTALDGRLDTIEALGPLATAAGLAAEASTRGSADTTLQANITAEAALARNADNLTGGTVADARIAATLARDSEVAAAVAAEATLARNADNLTSGTVADARIAASIARDTEVTNAVAAEVIARDAAISAAIAALVGSAPGLLDTLQEIADALGDDPNFAATITTALAGKQPLDSDLTAIAALTTTAYGRSFLELANAGAGRTLLGLGTAATSATGDFDPTGAAAAAQAASQPLDADLTAIAALATTAYGRAFLALADAAAGRTALGLGTAATQASGAFDAAGAAAAAQAASQPLDSDLTAVAALTTTSFGRALLELANAAALRIAAGLVIGTDVQAFDADLTLLARQVTARRTTDSTAVNNSVVLVDDSVLVLAVEASTTYLVSGILVIQSTSTADFRYRLSGPAGASGQTGTLGGGAAVALGVDSGSINIGNTSVLTVDGFVTVAGTAGSLTLAWAQGTATAVDTKLLIGSILRLIPVA